MRKFKNDCYRLSSNFARAKFFAGVIAIFSATAILATDSRYAAEESCAECHQAICAQGEKSDHRNSWNEATPETVLGDFSQSEFIHFGFDDIPALTDSDVREFLCWLEKKSSDNSAAANSLQNYFPNYFPARSLAATYTDKRKPSLVARFEDLAIALRGAKKETREKINFVITSEQKSQLIADETRLDNLRFLHAGEISAAQHRIVRGVRELIAAKKISIPAQCQIIRFSQCDSQFFMEIDSENGDVTSAQIRFVIGTRPLQQYVVEFSRGRWQCLPLAWDSVDHEWFHLYPNEQIRFDDPLHWTQPLQNANAMCVDCHVTAEEKNFDLMSRSYQTTYSAPNVGCQSCHGGCADHVARARERNLLVRWDSHDDLGTLRFWQATSQESIDACAICHSRRQRLASSATTSEEKFLDFLGFLDIAAPELFDGDLYYPDGQLREECFEYGSFLQAKMFSRGVRCTNCHDPHSTQLRFTKNRLCTQCHSPQLYDTPKHHFHPDENKPGTLCVECHMPESIYMVVDPRRDHNIRKPRPDETLTLNVPNACNVCHRAPSETPEWAAQQCEKWYAARRDSPVKFSPLDFHPRDYATAINAGRLHTKDAASQLISLIQAGENKEFRPIVRASAILLLGEQNFASANLEQSQIVKTLTPFLQSENPLERFAATKSLASLDSVTRTKFLAPLLQDATRAVRIEAARILSDVSEQNFSQELKILRQNVLREYFAAQNFSADQAATHLNVAVVLHNLSSDSLNRVAEWFAATARAARNQEEITAAQNEATRLVRQITDRVKRQYETSLALDERFIPSRINLAMLHHERGEIREAEMEFRKVLEIDPQFGEAAYSLGLLLAEESRWEEAATALRRAAELLPNHPRVRHNLAIVLQKLEN